MCGTVVAVYKGERASAAVTYRMIKVSPSFHAKLLCAYYFKKYRIDGNWMMLYQCPLSMGSLLS